jgi:2-(1,2-epoxy-1,2-dihydrophenyl)acetyl-CoA isomerase
MAFETILFSIEGGVAKITLNRPAKLNSITAAMISDLRRALDEAESDDNVRALLLTGCGRGFCAGQDLAERAVLPGGDTAPDLGESLAARYNPLILRLAKLPLPTVCAVGGVAAGAGANLALACDIVIAANSAVFVQAFAAVGLLPDCGGTWILPRIIGAARAKAVSMLAEKIPAQTAAEWGMIWRCVADGDLAKEADALAARLASGPTRGFALAKRALAASAVNSLEEQLALEAGLQREAGESADYREGVAAFLAKRKPRFTGK